MADTANEVALGSIAVITRSRDAIDIVFSQHGNTDGTSGQVFVGRS
ncbi:MAG: hypothetical protein GXP26_09715 [Planctomycetes bacterium]|nr:hypothetical protein [Planctomycetota bacterium]